MQFKIKVDSYVTEAYDQGVTENPVNVSYG